MKRFSRRKFLVGALGAPIAVAAEAIGLEPKWLNVERIRLSESPRHRFVHITDIHHKGDAPFLENVVSVVNAQNPDFVCFTGDLVEESEFAAEALKILAGVKAPLYGIPGNHDYWSDMDFDEAKEAFAKTGGRWLMDEEVTIRGGAVRLLGDGRERRGKVHREGWREKYFAEPLSERGRFIPGNEIRLNPGWPFAWRTSAAALVRRGDRSVWGGRISDGYVPNARGSTLCECGDRILLHERTVLLPAGDYCVRDLRTQGRSDCAIGGVESLKRLCRLLKDGGGVGEVV